MEKEINIEPNLEAINPPVEIVSLDTLKTVEKAELGLIDNSDNDDEESEVEKVERLADNMVSKQITEERQQEQLRLHSKTDHQLEADADQWLKSRGFDKDGNPTEGKERVGHIILAPRVSDPIEIYRRQHDPDEQARVLNTQIVKLESEVSDLKITPQSVNALRIIGSAQRAEISQYRVDVVTGLTHANLVATANTLVDEDPFEDMPFEQVLSTISRIRKLAGKEDAVTPEEEKDELEIEVLAEMADRLSNDNMEWRDRAELIDQIDAYWSPALILKMYRKYPETLVVLVRSMNELRDERLRRVLRRFIVEEKEKEE